MELDKGGEEAVWSWLVELTKKGMVEAWNRFHRRIRGSDVATGLGARLRPFSY